MASSTRGMKRSPHQLSLAVTTVRVEAAAHDRLAVSRHIRDDRDKARLNVTLLKSMYALRIGLEMGMVFSRISTIFTEYSVLGVIHTVNSFLRK